MRLWVIPHSRVFEGGFTDGSRFFTLRETWQRGGLSANHPRLHPWRSSVASSPLFKIAAVAAEASKAFTGLLERSLVAVLNFHASVGGTAKVARLVFFLCVACGEESSHPPVALHAFFAPSVFPSLPLDSVIVLIKRLGGGALGALLHLCPFLLTLLLLFTTSGPRESQKL